MNKWELDINTDGDIAVSFRGAPSTTRLLFVFTGSENEICVKLRSVLADIRVIPERSRDYLARSFMESLKAIDDMASGSVLEYFEDGGNVRVSFNESDRIIHLL